MLDQLLKPALDALSRSGNSVVLWAGSIAGLLSVTMGLRDQRHPSEPLSDLFRWLGIPWSSQIADFRAWLTADIRADALVTTMSVVMIALLLSYALHDASTSAAMEDAMHDQDRKRGSKYMRQVLDYNVTVVQKHMGSIWLLVALLLEAGGVTVPRVLAAALVLCVGLVAAHRLRDNEWHDVGFGLVQFILMLALALAAAPLKVFAFATQ